MSKVTHGIIAPTAYLHDQRFHAAIDSLEFPGVPEGQLPRLGSAGTLVLDGPPPVKNYVRGLAITYHDGSETTVHLKVIRVYSPSKYAIVAV